MPKQRAELEELKQLQQREDFWNDVATAQKVSRQAKHIEDRLDFLAALEKDAENLSELIALTDDQNDLMEVETELKALAEKAETLHIETLLSGKYDGYDAILTLHAGAGGTEACDWCSMLYRMYNRYCEKMGFKVYELDREAGDEAGIKSVDFRVEGENAYGYLKAEMGVHRLVRISPFDANKRRHTSFCSLEVMPEVEDDNEVEIKDDDIRIDIYHSGGAGGQNVNKVASAVRITHFPTGIVVQCQNERSQLQNKEMCFNMLRSKLLEKKIEERQAEADAMKGDVKKIEWGSQIRSYVFCPYTMAKDHRTGYEKGDIQAVMDGDIQGFIIDYLKRTV